MIEVRNLEKTFRTDKGQVQALDQVSLNIKSGDIFGIIGYSGAGKSTLLRCLNGLEKPDRGQVLIDGVDINQISQEELRKERKNIGMIFQHFNLLSQKNVYENLRFALEISGYNKEKIPGRIDELLDYVSLGDKKYSYPSELSGGEKQRVAIARAISNYPKILLSDEATSALDPETTKSILKLLKKINQDFNITIVMITHQMEVVKDICNNVAIMENAKILEMDTVENIFTNPKSETAKLFIESVNADFKEEIIDASEFSGSLMRLSFLGSSAQEPIISEAIRKFEVDINILSGNINKLSTTNIGHLIIEVLSSDEEKVDRLRNYLLENKVHVEVM